MRDIAIVVWHGQYSNDGEERLQAMRRRERAYPGLHNLRLVGCAGDWWLVADATPFELREGHMDVSAWRHKWRSAVSV